MIHESMSVYRILYIVKSQNRVRWLYSTRNTRRKYHLPHVPQVELSAGTRCYHQGLSVQSTIDNGKVAVSWFFNSSFFNMCRNNSWISFPTAAAPYRPQHV